MKFNILGEMFVKLRSVFVVSVIALLPLTTFSGTAHAAVQFDTLPVNAVLPTEANCASRVRPVAEIPTRGAINATYNARKGTGGNYTFPGVTGNFSGSTDEIIQWAACKWGMNEDLLRAQAVAESSWFQNAMGDFTTDANSCSPVYPIKTYPAQYPGDSVHANVCPESTGLMQIRWLYHKSAYYSSTTENSSTITNNAIFSTAYNVDYYGAVWRDCFNGNMTWLNTVERGETYAAGDASGCQGVWFAGRWRTAPALSYIAAVNGHVANRTWESVSFAGATSSNPVLTPASPTLDITPPTTSITSPKTNARVSGTITVKANASDNIRVTKVELLVDNVVIATDTTSPYTFSWNTRAYSTGVHTLRTRAYDAAGNTTLSTVISVRK